MTTPRQSGWCEKHGDFCWRYEDGSLACFWAQVVETTSDECVWSENGPWRVRVSALRSALARFGDIELNAKPIPGCYVVDADVFDEASAGAARVLLEAEPAPDPTS